MPQDPDSDQKDERYTGFASPAQHHSEDRISLDRSLITNPTATFFCRVDGHAMHEAGIPHGSLLVVDRSRIDRIHTGDVVVCAVDGEPVVRYAKLRRGLVLVAASPKVPDIHLGAVQEHTVWGVATHVITSLLPPSRQTRGRKRR